MKYIKKVSAILFLMLFSFTNVFASENTFNEFKKIIDNEMYSGTITYSYGNKLLKPLDFISAFQDKITDDGIYYSPFGSVIDYKTAAESLFNSKYTANVTYNMSKDYKKFDSCYEVNYTLPIEINKNFKNTSEFVMRMWVKYDLSKSENPYFDIIYDYPVMNKYMHISSDNTDVFNVGADITKSILDVDFLNEYKEKIFDVFKTVSNIERSGNKFTVKISDDGFKEILTHTVKMFTSRFKQYYSENASTEELSDFNAFVSDIKILADEILQTQFIGSDGIVFTFDTDGKKINGANITADIDTNVKKVMNAFDVALKKINAKAENAEDYLGLYDGVDMDDTDNPLSVITEQNSNIKCKLSLNYKYNDFNKKVKIEYPKLDNTNSIDFPVDYTDNDNFYYDENNYAAIDVDLPPYAVNGTIYIPLKAFLNECGIEDENITYSENGGIAAIAAVGNTDAKIQFGMSVFNIGSNTVIIDGNEYDLSAPIVEINGTTYVPSDFLYRFNGKLTAMTCYGNDYTHYSIEFANENNDM